MVGIVQGCFFCIEKDLKNPFVLPKGEVGNIASEQETSSADTATNKGLV